jgi:hypothetical protein
VAGRKEAWRHVVSVDKFEDADLVGVEVKERIFGGVSNHRFAQNDESGDGPAVETFDAPIDDVFGGVAGDVSTVFGFLLPIDERAGTADGNSFVEDVFGVGVEGSAEEIGVFEKAEKSGLERGRGTSGRGSGTVGHGVLVAGERGKGPLSLTLALRRGEGNRLAGRFVRREIWWAVGRVGSGRNRRGMGRRGLGEFDEGRAAEDEADVALGGAGGGIEEGGALTVGSVFLVAVGLDAGEVFFAGGFDGVLSGEDVAEAAPIGEGEVVLEVSGVDRHGSGVGGVRS